MFVRSESIFFFFYAVSFAIFLKASDLEALSAVLGLSLSE